MLHQTSALLIIFISIDNNELQEQLLLLVSSHTDMMNDFLSINNTCCRSIHDGYSYFVKEKINGKGKCGKIFAGSERKVNRSSFIDFSMQIS